MHRHPSTLCFALRATLNLALSAAAALLVLSSSAFATTYYWDTTNTGTWATGTNWTTDPTGVTPGSVVPTATDSAFFNGSSVNGPETVQLDAAASISGLTFANTGTTVIESSVGAQSLTIDAGGLTINSGAGAVTLGDTSQQLNILLSNNQSWANNSANLLTVTNTVTNAGNTTPFTLTLSGSGVGGTTFSGAISDGGTTGTTALTINTTGGTTTLLGTNTFSGGATVTSGSLTLKNQLAVQKSTLTMNGGGLIFDSSVGGHAFTFGGLAAASSGAGYNIALQDNAATPNAVALSVGGNNASTTYSGSLTGLGSLVKTGSGTLSLAATNAYSGPTTISSGTIKLNNGGFTPSYQYYKFQVNQVQSGSGNLVQLSELAFYSSGTNNVNGVRVIPASATSTGGNSGTEGPINLSDSNFTTKWTDSTAVTTTGPQSVTFQFSFPQTFTGYDWATANDTTPGRNPNNWTVYGSNDGINFTPLDNEVNSGATPTSTFTYAAGWSLPQTLGSLPASTAVQIASAGILDLNGIPNQVITSLADSNGGGGSVINSAPTAATLTIYPPSGSTRFSGSITDSGFNPISLVKIGAGTQVLAGASTYSGATMVNVGTLRVAQGASLGNTAISVASSATFGAQPTTGNSINVAGSLSLANAAIFDMSGDSNAGALNFAGSLLIGNATAGATLKFDLGTNGGGGTVTDALNTTSAASAQGTNSITIVGFGTTALTNGTYNLITASGGGLNSGGTFALTNANSTITVNGSPYRLVLINSANAEQLGVSAGTNIAATWQATGSGSFAWNSPASNWNTNPFAPAQAGDSAAFGTSAGTNSQTVNLDQNRTVGAVTFNNTTPSAGSYTIAGGTGPFTLTLDNSGSAPVVTNSNGNNTISAPLALNGAPTFAISPNTSLTLAGPLAASTQVVTVTGGGTLIAANTGALGTSPVVINGGTFRVNVATAAGGTVAGFGGTSTSATGAGTGWTVNNSGISSNPINADVLKLTDGVNGETRSAFRNAPVSFAGGFSTSFTYNLASANGADGFAFVLQNDPRGASALGGGGGALGYGGTGTSGIGGAASSVGVEFNIFSSSSSAQGTALGINGGVPATGSLNYTSNGQTNTSNFLPITINGAPFGTNTDPMLITVNYTPPAPGSLAGTLSETVTDTALSSNNTYTTSYSINLANVLGSNSAYVGFTGATGGVNSSQTISNFSYSAGGGYANNVTLPTGAGTTIDVAGVTASNAGVTMGTLTAGAGSQLNVTASTVNAAAQGYGIKFGAATLTGAVTFNLASAAGGGSALLTLGNTSDGASSGSINLTGTGSLFLSKYNTFSGGVTVGAGTNLIVANNTPLGSANGSVTLAGGRLQAIGGSPGINPVAAAGWNQDIVYAVGQTAPTSANNVNAPAWGQSAGVGVDGSYFFYQSGVSGATAGAGLPPSGTIVSTASQLFQTTAVAPTLNTTFQLQPYGTATTGALNAIQLSNNTSVKNINGTAINETIGAMTLSNPSAFTELSVLSATGSGPGKYTMTLNFANGQTLAINSTMAATGTTVSGSQITSPDWFPPSGTGRVISGLGRFNGGNFDGTPNNPSLTEQDFIIPAADQNLPISSISFGYVAGGHVDIMGLSGTLTAPSYSNALNITASSAIDVTGPAATTLSGLTSIGNTSSSGPITLSVTGGSTGANAPYNVYLGTYAGAPATGGAGITLSSGVSLTGGISGTMQYTLDVANNGSGAATVYLGPLTDNGNASTLTLQNSGTTVLNYVGTMVAGSTVNVGPATVGPNGGNLRVGTASGVSATGNAAVVVNSGGTLGVTSGSTQGAIGGATTIKSGATVFGASGTQLFIGGGLTLQGSTVSNFTLSATPNNTSNALIATSSGSGTSLNIGGTDMINITNASLFPVQGGTYDLFGYTGSGLTTTGPATGSTLNFTGGGSMTLGNQPQSSLYTYTLSNNSAQTQIDLIVALAKISWTGTQMGTGAPNNSWDTTAGSTNWASNALAPVSFVNGSPVGFQDTNVLNGNALVPNTGGVATVNIAAGGVQPLLVVFANAGAANGGVDYVLTGGPIGDTASPTSLNIVGQGTFGGSVTLSNSNTFSGPISVALGNLIVTNATALGNSSGATVTATGGALVLQSTSGSSVVYGGKQSGSGTVGLTLNGAGSVANPGALTSASGINTYSGPISVGTSGAGSIASTSTANNDSLTLTGGISLGTGTMTFVGAGVTNVATTAISDGGAGSPGSIAVSGPGTVALAAASSYYGSTSVNAGTLVLQNATALGNSSGVTVASGAALELTTTSGTSASYGFAANGPATVPVTLNGPGVVASPASGALVSASGINIYLGQISVGASGAATVVSNSTANGDALILNGGVSLPNAATLTIAGPGNTSVYPAVVGGAGISGAGTLAMSGAGTLTLNAPSAGFTGTVRVNSGTTVVNTGNPIGTATVVMNSGTLRITPAAGASIAGFGGNGTGWTVTSNASATSTVFPSPDVLQLTASLGGEARAAFYNTPVPLTIGSIGFTASFTYKATNLTFGGADGVALIVQNDSRGAAALGGSGGSLGYSGITPSAALELNIFPSAAGGIGTTVGVNGAINTSSSVSPVSLASGDAINITVTYNPAAQTFSEKLVDPTAGTSFSTSYNLNANLATLLGNSVYVGVSGADGGSTATQQISNFSYSLQPSATGLSGNNVVLTAGTTSTIDVGATAALPTLTMGTLTVNAGAAPTLNVTASQAAPGLAYGLTLGATVLNSNVTLNVVNNTNGASVATGTLRLGAVSENGGSFGITKTGSGTVVLTGAGSNSGTTLVNQGNLTVTHSIIAGGNPLGTGAVRLGGGTLTLLPAAGQQVTVPTTGYNQDVVWADSEAGAAAGTTAGFDNAAKYVLYEAGVPGSPGGGLPNNHTFTSGSNANIKFTLQPYNAPNSLELFGPAANSNATGTLTLSSPAKYNSLNLLSSTGAGTGNFSFTLNFGDGSSTLVTGNSSGDWFNGSPNALNTLGRFHLTDSTFDTGAITGANPRLYELDYTLATGDQSKVLDSITFNLTNGVVGNGPYFNIMALSGFNTSTSQTLGNNVTVASDSTIDSQNAGTTTFGTLAIGANTLTLTNSVNSSATYGATFGATTLTGTANFNVATSNGTLTLGSVSDGAGPAFGITVSGPGTVVLASANAFRGNVTVSNGTLRLADGSANNISGSPTITVAGGANLDVTGLLNGTLSLGTGTNAVAQTLKGGGTVTGGVIVPALNKIAAGSGATLTITNGLTLQDQSHSSFTLGVPNGSGNASTSLVDITGGGLTVPNTATNIVDLSGSTQAGDVYELYAYTGTAPLGQFMVGTNAAGNFNYSFTITNSEVDLNVLSAAVSARWDFNGNGNFSDITKWNPAESPSGPGLMATFGDGVSVTVNTSPSLTVTIDGADVVGTLLFNNSHGTNYILGNGGNGTGLTMDNNHNGATITVNAAVTGGNPTPTTTIYSNLTLADNTTVNVATGNTLLLSISGTPAATIGESGGSHSLTKTGPGALTVDRVSTYTGSTIVSNGTLTVTASGSIGSGPLEVDGASGNAAAVNLLNTTTSQSVAGLTGTVTGGSARVNVTNGATLTVNQPAGNSTFGGTVALTAGATAGTGVRFTIAGSGTEVLTAAPQLGNNTVLNVTGGTLRVAAVSGTASVGSGVTAKLSGSGTLELAGTVSALGTSTAANRVAITSTSFPTDPTTLLVSAGNQQVGGVTNIGAVQVNANASLTADHITATSLVIGGDASNSALVTIAASDSNGDPLATDGFALAGSLAPSAQFAAGGLSSSSLLAAGGSATGSNLAGSSLGALNLGSSVAAVPEPSTIVLLVLGGFACLLPALRRRIRR